MKYRFQWAAAACLILGSAIAAQGPMNGMNFFHKPSIADIFQPTVGKGAIYETTRHDKKETIEMSVVAKDSVDGKEAYWMEFATSNAAKGGEMNYVKILVTKADFQFHRMVMQQAGKPPMEFPFNPQMNPNGKSETQADIDKWHKVGTETITVPAGTFKCDHYQKDDGKGDVWASSEISPIAMVKEVSPDQTMVLMKALNDVKDHITGTPQVFDPQAMRQQHQH